MAGTAAGAQKARAARQQGVQAPEQVKVIDPAEVAVGPLERPKDAAQIRLESKFGGRRHSAAVAPPSHYVVARRDLNWEGLVLHPGETIPGAEQWARLDSWVRAGRVQPAYGGAVKMTSATPPTPEAEPEELEDNAQSAPEDDDPLTLTGEPLPEDLEEVSK